MPLEALNRFILWLVRFDLNAGSATDKITLARIATNTFSADMDEGG